MRVFRAHIYPLTEEVISKKSSRKISSRTFNFLIRKMETFSSFVNILGASPRWKANKQRGKETDKLDLSSWNSQKYASFRSNLYMKFPLRSISFKRKRMPFWNGYKKRASSISLDLS